MRRSLFTLALSACFLFPSQILLADDTAQSKGAAAASAEKKELWKPEDIVYAEAIQQMHISPNAQYLVWVKSTGDKEKDARVSNLFLSALTIPDKTLALTRGSDNNTQPKWSPDGQLIAFTSNRARYGAKPDTAPVQIWLINPFGGEPWSITELARPPRRIDWLDKDTVLFSAQEDPTLYAQEVKQKKDDSEVVDDAEHEPPVRLYKINVKDKKITRLTTNTDWISNWAASKDGKYVVASHDKSLHYTFDQKTPPVTVLHNLSDGSEQTLFSGSRIYPRAFAWAPDNSGFYAIAPHSTHPKFLTATIEQLYFYDVAAGKHLQVPLDWENGIGFNVAATQDGFIAALAAGAQDEVSRYTRTRSGNNWAWKRASLEGEHAKRIQTFEVDEYGMRIVYAYSTASKMPQLYRAQLDGNKIFLAEQLTKLNDGLVKNRAFAKSEIIRWKGANDEEVEGILYYPTNYETGKKYPVITAIHGGPTGHDSDSWDDNWAYPTNLLTQRGAFVLRPNYHGSGNYGLKWVESICCGKYYDLETPDINAGVDHLITKGFVDPDKVATLGWSNGSILSTSLITTYPDRYKVASVGAGDIEWISDWGNVTFGDSFDSYYFGKSPFEDPDLYIKKSPFFKMDKIKAPVLIFHGASDVNVPPAQSWSYFRALQYYGKAPVKFVVFPGEPHSPRKLTHQMRKLEEEVAWFDKYFFKIGKPLNDAVKKGSPLEESLKKENFAIGCFAGLGCVYAVTGSKGEAMFPTPEVVQRGDIAIGRFEVTRAQFAEFDKSFKFDARAANFPIGGVTLDRAKSYVEWLSKQRKDLYRIAYEDEVKSLYENRSGENTLDYWAGYAANLEDAAKLREASKKLNGTAPLLKEVGSFHGQGQDDEEPIYDLGGNVAEWVLTRDGQGKVIGGSADCPADAKANCNPAPDYVGFRVVRGAAKPAPKASDEKR